MTGRLFLFFLCAFMLLTSREPPWADAHVVYDTTQALIDRAQLDVHTEGGPPWFYAHRNGRKYGVFPLGNVVAMVPSYLAYKLLRHVSWLPDRPTFALASHLSPSLMMAGVCALFFHLLRRRRVAPGWALGATLALGFATLVFVYARNPYSEALQTLALLWLVERALDQGERVTTGGLGWLGLAAGVVVNAKLVNVLFLPLVAWYVIDRAVRRGQLGALVRALPLAVVIFAELVAVALWHNQLKTGSIWDSGYQIKNGVFSGDLFAGLYGFFFSSGKSVFLYVPPLVLAVLGAPTAWRERRAETMLLVGIIGLSLVFNAKFRHWHADYCWGPRHLVAVLPLAGLVVFPWLPRALARGRVQLRRAAVAAVLVAGVGVQLLGASIYWDHYIRILIAVKDQTGAAGWFHEHLSHGHYIPVFSPLRGQVWLLSHLLRRDPALDRDPPWRPILTTPADLSDGWNRLRLDWWLLEYTTGDPHPRAAAALMTLLALATLGSGAAVASGLRQLGARDEQRHGAAAA